MTTKPSMAEHQAMLDDEVLSWLTQDRRSQIDFSRLDDEQFEAEAAAALYSLAQLDALEPMPASLTDKLMAAADAFSSPAPVPTAPRRSLWSSIGLAWGSASFASVIAVALAVRLATLPQTAAPGADTPQIALDQAAHYPVQPGPDAAGKAVRGEVVWDPRSSGGYLKLRGLPVNDPKREQYQLWVFDGTRDQRYPVDGGLFNVARDGELELWIRVPIPVRDAAMFAVTVEQPGGTVVSERGRIVALAKAGT